MADSLTSLLTEARAALGRGDLDATRAALTQVLRQDPGNAQAWLLMSGVVATPEQKRDCLERVLRADPNNTAARRGLEMLAAPAAPIAPAAPAAPSPFAPLSAVIAEAAPTAPPPARFAQPIGAAPARMPTAADLLPPSPAAPQPQPAPEAMPQPASVGPSANAASAPPWMSAPPTTPAPPAPATEFGAPIAPAPTFAQPTPAFSQPAPASESTMALPAANQSLVTATPAKAKTGIPVGTLLIGLGVGLLLAALMIAALTFLTA